MSALQFLYLRILLSLGLYGAILAIFPHSHWSGWLFLAVGVGSGMATWPLTQESR
jgi:hypothetical protein